MSFNKNIHFISASTAGTAEADAKPKNPSNAPNAGSMALVPKITNGNTVSCIIELKTVWFNFAAPPRTPITRKIDFTRLDWNLLSTASPAINAWMNPSNRFGIKTVDMFRNMYRRSTAIVACLMAESLDVQGIHMPVKVLYYLHFIYLFMKYMMHSFLFSIAEPLWTIDTSRKNTPGRPFLSTLHNFTKLRSTL